MCVPCAHNIRTYTHAQNRTVCRVRAASCESYLRGANAIAHTPTLNRTLRFTRCAHTRALRAANHTIASNRKQATLHVQRHAMPYYHTVQRQRLCAAQSTPRVRQQRDDARALRRRAHAGVRRCSCTHSACARTPAFRRTPPLMSSCAAHHFVVALPRARSRARASAPAAGPKSFV